MRSRPRILTAVAIVVLLGVVVAWTTRQPFLLHAAVRGDVAILKGLVAIGADPNSDSAGSLPLYAAAWYGHVDAVDCLISLGADVNRRDPSGFTPLIAAASQGHDVVVTSLVRHGADLHLKGKCGTALEVARANGRTSTVALLSAFDR